VLDQDALLPWIRLAGAGQLALAAGSFAIPVVLRWRDGLAPLPVLLRQMFWVYSGYIWATNLAFGLVSTFGSELLLNGSPLATCVLGYIALYWTARIAIQLLYFDLSELPRTRFHRVCQVVLEALFWGVALVYGAAFYASLTGSLA